MLRQDRGVQLSIAQQVGGLVGRVRIDVQPSQLRRQPFGKSARDVVEIGVCNVRETVVRYEIQKLASRVGLVVVNL